MKNLLLLDIDDTLCDSSKAYEKAMRESLKFLRRKYRIEEEVFREVIKKAREEIHIELNGSASMHNRFLYFQRAFEILGIPVYPHYIEEVSEVYWKTVLKNLKLKKNVKYVLAKLKENGYKIGIVTDLLAHIQAKKIKRLSIAKYIDFMVTSEEAGREKPHPSIFLLALKKGNAKEEEALMVGDNEEKDIKGAKAIGIEAVDVKKIKDFREILKYFEIKKRSNRKMLILDMMGVIFKQGRVIKNILHPMLRERGEEISYEELKKKYLKLSLGLGEDIYEVLSKKVEKEFLNKLKVDREVFGLINKAKKKGYYLGIVSDIPKQWGEYLLKREKIREEFKVIVFSSEYKERKPSEKLYKIVIDKANVKPFNCYFVDDKLYNLGEARHLRIKTIWKKGDKGNSMFIPDYEVKRLREIEKII